MSAEPTPPRDRSTAAPAPVPDTTTLDIKAKQAAYHDWEAATYEDKFSISYDERCIDYARDRFRKAVPDGFAFDRVLEVGAGTGFFVVNLALGGCLGPDAQLEATDISAGMLEVCADNARAHGVEVTTRPGDAEHLPYGDDTFDLVIGHAVLHHLPVPAVALREMHRVLRPGGWLVIAGEPTEIGDRLAGMVKRATYSSFRAVTALPGLEELRKPTIRQAGGSAEDEVLASLEHEVDLHTFRPRDVEHAARIAGFREVRVVTEELTSSWLGWAVRTIEGSVRPGTLGARWAWAAFHGYSTLHRLDDAVLSRVVPRDLFYNLILHARKAGPP